MVVQQILISRKKHCKICVYNCNEEVLVICKDTQCSCTEILNIRISAISKFRYKIRRESGISTSDTKMYLEMYRANSQIKKEKKLGRLAFPGNVNLFPFLFFPSNANLFHFLLGKWKYNYIFILTTFVLQIGGHQAATFTRFVLLSC